MSVFEDYADFYDLLYQDKDYAGEARFVASLLEDHRVRAVLDLGCGTGQHAFQLARLGYSVVGVDRSERMLSRARERCSLLPDEPRPRFDRGDVREFRDGQRYDAVISLFHVMSYQVSDEDATRACATAAAHLSAGGTFVFDLWHRPALDAEPPQVRVKRAEDARTAVVRISEPAIGAGDGLVSVTFTTFIRTMPQDTWNQYLETHVMRPYDLDEIRRLLEQSGMEFIAAHEGYTLQDVADSSFNVLVVARRR